MKNLVALVKSSDKCWTFSAFLETGEIKSSSPLYGPRKAWAEREGKRIPPVSVEGRDSEALANYAICENDDEIHRYMKKCTNLIKNAHQMTLQYFIPVLLETQYRLAFVY